MMVPKALTNMGAPSKASHMATLRFFFCKIDSFSSFSCINTSSRPEALMVSGLYSPFTTL